MVYEAIDVCNRALLMLGIAPLQSFEDPTPEAEVARTFYPTVRDTLLSAYPWSFATRTALVQTGTSHADDPKFLYRVPMPQACVRVVAVCTTGRSRALPYRVMGATLACPVVPVVIDYVAAVPEDTFPAFFVSVLTTQLAAALCLPLTENTRRAEHLTRKAEHDMQRARFLDASDQPPPVLSSSVLVDVRQ